MPTVSSPGGLASSVLAVRSAKSIQQQALEKALAEVREVAANPGGAVVLQQIREHQAAAAQARLSHARERYQLLRKSMSQVLVFGDGRFAARLAKDAAALARQIAGAAKDMAQAANDGAPSDAVARREALDGFMGQARSVVLGARNLIDAARIANGRGEDGPAQAKRAKEIARARRDSDDALADIVRDLGRARHAASIAIDA
jgi:hypothetical protein